MTVDRVGSVAVESEAQLVLILLIVCLSVGIVKRAATLPHQVSIPLSEHFLLKGENISRASLNAVLVENLLV